MWCLGGRDIDVGANSGSVNADCSRAPQQWGSRSLRHIDFWVRRWDLLIALKRGPVAENNGSLPGSNE